MDGDRAGMGSCGRGLRCGWMSRARYQGGFERGIYHGARFAVRTPASDSYVIP